MDSCAFCGADIGEGAQFCAKCGSKVAEEHGRSEEEKGSDLGEEKRAEYDAHRAHRGKKRSD